MRYLVFIAAVALSVSGADAQTPQTRKCTFTSIDNALVFEGQVDNDTTPCESSEIIKVVDREFGYVCESTSGLFLCKAGEPVAFSKPGDADRLQQCSTWSAPGMTDIMSGNIDLTASTWKTLKETQCGDSPGARAHRVVKVGRSGAVVCTPPSASCMNVLSLTPGSQIRLAGSLPGVAGQALMKIIESVTNRF